MNLRTVALPQDIDLRTYLSEAEKSIDALSDEELDVLEKELEASIRKLVNPTPVLHLVGAEPRKRKIPRKAYPVLSGLLVAALALLFMRTAEQDSPTTPWTTKGQIEHTVVCSLLIQQADAGSAELTEAGYLVQASAPVYAKTSCREGLKLEALENGVWVVKEVVQSQEGYLAKEGNLIDLRDYLGKNLRIQSQEGLSEEFELKADR